MRIGVITFPGSLDERDAARAVRLAGAEPVALWHADRDLHGVDAVILPGGFSYGDYLRCGAIARFAPVMEPLVAAARVGLPVLGICNGFQILCEAHLLPGRADPQRRPPHFVGPGRAARRWRTAARAWTRAYADGEQIVVPLKSGEGAYVADRRHAGVARGRRPDRAQLHRRQPQRVRGRHRGRVQRDGQRGRPDAAPRARDRSTLTGPSADGPGFFASVVAAVSPG